MKRNQANDLYLIPKSKYTSFTEESLKGQSSYRTTTKVFGREVTAVIVYNPALEAGQLLGITVNKEKTAIKLQELEQKLLLRKNGEIKKGRKPTKESVTAAVNKILSTEYMPEVFTYTIFEKDGNVLLTYAESPTALQEHLTVRPIFHWTNEKIKVHIFTGRFYQILSIST